MPLAAVRSRLADIASTTETATPPIDSVLSTLQNERRRLALRFAVSASGSFSLGELVDNVAADEFGAEYATNERKTVYTTMYQHHIDELVSVGALVPVDSDDAHCYQSGPMARPLVAVLDAIESTLRGELDG